MPGLRPEQEQPGGGTEIQIRGSLGGVAAKGGARRREFAGPVFVSTAKVLPFGDAREVMPGRR